MGLRMDSYVPAKKGYEDTKLVKNMKITKIYHPKKKMKADRDLLRVAAYCRVSTNSDDQLNSFEVQKTAYSEMVSNRAGWDLVGIYADRGITGTSVKKREQFQKMITDCEKGMIDCVVCKSLSRFARNTKDAIFYIRKLQELGVRLIIEKEDIDTDDAYSELTLTILAAFAEEESRSISENLKWAKRKKAQTGDVQLTRLYGYRKSEDNYEVVPEEAKIVRMIFDLYEQGATAGTIAKTLTDKNIMTHTGNSKWNVARIFDMIENEKYMGDCRTQKTFKKDVIDGRTYLNRGELPSVYIKNHHDAIISRKQFERCRVIMELRGVKTPLKYPFGDYLRCPHCGSVLHYRSQNPYKYYFYCDGEDSDMACGKFMVHSNLVKDVVLNAYNHLDMKALQNERNTENPDKAEVEKLLRVKEEHSVFEKVDYWWLDELVKEISFGRHTSSERINEGTKEDDRTICIIWKCGLTTTVPSGIKGDPGKKAENLFSRMCGDGESSSNGHIPV